MLLKLLNIPKVKEYPSWLFSSCS